MLRIMRRGWLLLERRGRRGREQRATRNAGFAAARPGRSRLPVGDSAADQRTTLRVYQTSGHHNLGAAWDTVHAWRGVQIELYPPELWCAEHLFACLWEAAPVCRCSEVEARCAFFGIAVVEVAWTWSYVSSCLAL